MATDIDEANPFATPPSRMVQSPSIKSPPVPVRITKKGRALRNYDESGPLSLCTNLFPRDDMHTESVGHPSLQIYRVKLPERFIARLDPLISLAEDFTQATLGGWRTNLYSLTKQDVPVRQIPGGLALVDEITPFIVSEVHRLYGTKTVRMDANQPHILKYDESHRGVQLHHDYCSVTANLVLNQSFVGGGTYIPATGTVVHLKVGEVLLHPGTLVHSGRDVIAGNRYLLVYFFQLD